MSAKTKSCCVSGVMVLPITPFAPDDKKKQQLQQQQQQQQKSTLTHVEQVLLWALFARRCHAL